MRTNFMSASNVSRWRQFIFLLMVLVVQPSTSSLQLTGLPAQIPLSYPLGEMPPSSPPALATSSSQPTQATHSSQPAQATPSSLLAQVPPSNQSAQARFSSQPAQARSSSQPVQARSSRAPVQFSPSDSLAQILQPKGVATQIPLINLSDLRQPSDKSLTDALSSSFPEGPVFPLNFSLTKQNDVKNDLVLSALQSLDGEGKSTDDKKPVSDSLLSLISSLGEESSGSDESGIVEPYATDNSLPLLTLIEPGRTLNTMIAGKPSLETGLLRKITFRNNSFPLWENTFRPSSNVDNDLQKPFLLSTHDTHISQIDSPGKYTHRRFWPHFHILEKHEQEPSSLKYSPETSAPSIKTSTELPSKEKIQYLKQRLLRTVSALSEIHPSLKTGFNLNSFETFEETSSDLGALLAGNAASVNISDTLASLEVLKSHEQHQLLSKQSAKFNKFHMNQTVLPKLKDLGQKEAVENKEEISEAKLESSLSFASNEMNSKINATRATAVHKPFSSIKRMLDIINRQNESKKKLSHNFTVTEFERDASKSDETIIPRSPALPRHHSSEHTLPKQTSSEEDDVEQLPQHLPLISEALLKDEKESKTSNGFLNPEASVFGTAQTLDVQDEWFDHDAPSYDDYYLYDTEYFDNSNETEDENTLPHVSRSEDHGISDNTGSIAGDNSVFHKANDPNVLAEHPISGQVLSKTKQNSHQSFISNTNDIELYSKLVPNSEDENIFSTEASNMNVRNDSILLPYRLSTGVPLDAKESISAYPSFNYEIINKDFLASKPTSSKYLASPVTATSRSKTGDALTFGGNQKNLKRLIYDRTSHKELNNFSLSNTSTQIDNKPLGNHGNRLNGIASFGTAKTLQRPSLNGLNNPSSSLPTVKSHHHFVFRASPSTADPASFTPSLYQENGLNKLPKIQQSTAVSLTNVPALTTMRREIFRERTNAATNVGENFELPLTDDLLNFPLLPFNVTRRPYFSISTPISTYSHAEYVHQYSLRDSSSSNIRISSTPSPEILHISTSGTTAESHLPLQTSSTNKPTTLQQLLLNGYTLNPSVSSLTYHEIGAHQAHNSRFSNVVADIRPPHPPKLKPPSGVDQNLHFVPQIGSYGPWSQPNHQYGALNKLRIQSFTKVTPQPRILQPLQFPPKLLARGAGSSSNKKTIHDNILSYQAGFNKHNLKNFHHERDFGQIPQANQNVFTGRQISSLGKSILPRHMPSNLISSYTSYDGQLAPVTSPSTHLNSLTQQNPHMSLQDLANPIQISNDNSFPKTFPLTDQVGHSHVTQLSPVHQILQNPLSSSRPIEHGGPGASQGALAGKVNISPASQYGFTSPSFHASQHSSAHTLSNELSPSTHNNNPASQLQVFLSPLQHFKQTVPHLTFKTISGHYPGEDLLPEAYQYLFPTVSPGDPRGKSSLASESENAAPPSTVVQPLPIKNLKEIIIDEKGRLIDETFYTDNIEGGASDEKTTSDDLSSKVHLENDSSFITAVNNNVQVTGENLVNNLNVEENLKQDKGSATKNVKNLLEVVGKEGTFTTKNFIEDFISVTPLGGQDDVVSDTPPRVDLSAIGNLLRPTGNPPVLDEISVFTTVREALRGIISDPSYLMFPEERSKSTLSGLRTLSPINVSKKDPLVATQEPHSSSKSHEFVLIVTDRNPKILQRLRNDTFVVPPHSLVNHELEESVKLIDVLKKINETADIQKLSFSSGHVFKGQLDLDSPNYRGGSDISKSISDQMSSTLDVGSQNAISIPDAVSFLESSFGNMRNDSLKLLLSRFSDTSQLLHLDTPVYIWRPGPGNAFGMRLLDDMHFIIPSMSTSSEFPSQTTTVTRETPVTEASNGDHINPRSELNEQSFLPRKQTSLTEPVSNSSDVELAGLDYLDNYDNFDIDFEDSIPSISFEDTSSEIKKDVTTEAPVSISTVSVVDPALADDFIRELKKLFIISESEELVNIPLSESSKIIKKVLKRDQDTSLKRQKFPREFHNSRILEKLLASRNKTSPAKTFLADDRILHVRKSHLCESIDTTGEFGKKIPPGCQLTEKKSGVNDFHDDAITENPNLVTGTTILPVQTSFTQSDNSIDILNSSEIHTASKEMTGASTTLQSRTETTTMRFLDTNLFGSPDISGQKLTANAYNLLNTTGLAEPSTHRQPRNHNLKFSTLNATGFTMTLNSQTIDSDDATRISDTTASDESSLNLQLIDNNTGMNMMNTRAFIEPTVLSQPSTRSILTSVSDVPQSSIPTANSQRNPLVTLSKVLIPQEPILLLSEDSENEFYLSEPVTSHSQDTVSVRHGNAHMAPFSIYNERFIEPVSSMENSKTDIPISPGVSMSRSSIKRDVEHTKRSQNSENENSHSVRQPIFGKAETQNFDESEYFFNEPFPQMASNVSVSTKSNFGTLVSNIPHSVSYIPYSISNATQFTIYSEHSSTQPPPNPRATFSYPSTLPAHNLHEEFLMKNSEHEGANKKIIPFDKNSSLPVTKNTLLYISRSLFDKKIPPKEVISEAGKTVKNSSINSAATLPTETSYSWKLENTTTSTAFLQKPDNLSAMKNPFIWKPNVPPSLVPESETVKKNFTSSLFWRPKRTRNSNFIVDVENTDNANRSVKEDSTGFSGNGRMNGIDDPDRVDRVDGPVFTDIERMGEGSFIPVHGPYGTDSAQRRLIREPLKLLLQGGQHQTRDDKRTTYHQTFERSDIKLIEEGELIDKAVPNRVEHRVKTSDSDSSNKHMELLERRNSNEGLRREGRETSFKRRVFLGDVSHSSGNIKNVSRIMKKLDGASNEGWRWYS